jgi:O2-independent ubiquinone biosynthesis accessory factor UbiT
MEAMMTPLKGELPEPLRLLLKPAAFLPIGPALTLGLRRFAGRRPDVFERLGPFCRSHFLVEPTDLPMSFLISPDGKAARIRSFRSANAVEKDVHIKGPILILLGLLDGTFDGDALFFNRMISVTGKTDALVALRNSIEEAELQPSDFLGLKGEPARILDRTVRMALADLRRLFGATMEGAA